MKEINALKDTIAVLKSNSSFHSYEQKLVDKLRALRKKRALLQTHESFMYYHFFNPIENIPKCLPQIQMQLLEEHRVVGKKTFYTLFTKYKLNIYIWNKKLRELENNEQFLRLKNLMNNIERPTRPIFCSQIPETEMDILIEKGIKASTKMILRKQ